jgi:hypothetical protein
MRALLTLIVGAFLLLTAAPVWAASDRRVALVIGNSAYRKFPQLPNPRNDAEDVTAALKRIGFTVLGGVDMSREQMRDSLRQFARTAQDAEAAMVFYAGHGLQYRGRNYLVPVDAKLEDEFDLEYETVRVDDVVEELNRADGPRILVLDACRNLPLATRSRDPFSSTGLAKLSGRGLIVAYATQANQVAYDGTGRNSIFTGAFIKSVQEPGLDVAQVFQRVSMNVDRATNGRQTPELSLSYPGQFYLNKGETEREAWPRARASNDPQVLRDFIAKYPNSFLVDDAKDLIQRLEARASAPAERSAPVQNDRSQAPTLQLARRPDDAAAARAREEAERLAWQRLQDEQKRRAEARQQAERERLAAEEQEKQRLAQEEERRKAEAKRAEVERQAEEARQKKLAEERSAAEARERQRLEREARLEEERRRLEARKAEQERLAEEARQKKLAEERSAAEARERQRLEREARLEEERRQAELRKAEQERLAEEARQKKLAEERSAAEARERQRLEREARLEEERRQAELRKAEQERVAEEARQRKVAEERAAAEARERQRIEREARLEEERRQAELRKAEQDRLAEEARQRKVAEERAAAEARERQRLEREARLEEERRQADARRIEQERVTEEARLRKLAEEREAAEARERQRVAQEAARREEEARKAEEEQRVRQAAAEKAERDRLAWLQLEELQRRRANPAPAEAGPPAQLVQGQAATADASPQTTLDAVKSGRGGSASSALVSLSEASARPAEQAATPMRLASNDAAQPAIVAPATPSAFPKEILDQDQLIRATKAELGRIGCLDDEADAKWDRDARDALSRFGRQVKLSPLPTDPSPSLLEDLEGRPAHVCPLECGPGERVKGEQCVAVARPERIEPKPAPRREPKPRAVAQERRAPAPEPRVVRPRPQPAPAQAPVSTASSAPKPAISRPVMGVGF